MSLTLPAVDGRTYQELLNEALARIPVHNPEWTNFNRSDPGVTLIELFAFMTENLLYRSNQIPERNRVKFLSLLGVPLRPASPARGLVAFTNERGPLQTFTLNAGVEVRAGQVPFRTDLGLDVLPVEAQVLYKKRLANPAPQVADYYRQLYASFDSQRTVAGLQLYQTLPLSGRANDEVDVGADAVDGSLWVALMLRAGADRPYERNLERAREALGGKTLSLGVVPSLAGAGRGLPPGGVTGADGAGLVEYSIPKVARGGRLEKDARGAPAPRYQRLLAAASADVLVEPGVVQLTLPPASELRLWDDLDPLESGVGDLPPALEDTEQHERVITWVRVRPSAAAQARLLWVGINAAPVTQRAHVSGELLPVGTGDPDQTARLANAPVLPGSVRVTVTAGGRSSRWVEIDDLLAAGPEVPVPDPRLPPGMRPVLNPFTDVFTLDAESGEIRFGDGTHGRRPPLGASLRAEYDYGVGDAGNVGAGSVSTGAALPAGIRVTNPVRTWGGARAETVAEGEKQIARYLQHRDRLVTEADFETITLRAPGVDIGRVEVIAAFNPELAPNEPGDAPGAVTLMLIPRSDPVQPDAPVPDRLFLDAVCDYLEPRRLVTTEVFLRGPAYKGVWVSVGINVVAGAGAAEVREAVRAAVLRFLAPLPADPSAALDTQAAPGAAPRYADTSRGWPLRKAVTDREILAVASRVEGVLSVNGVLVAEGAGAAAPQITMTGLELPRVLGISVTVGEAVGLDELRGQTQAGGGGGAGTGDDDGDGDGGGGVVLPVPVIPEEC
jgi:hypothetical protein